MKLPRSNVRLASIAGIILVLSIGTVAATSQFDKEKPKNNQASSQPASTEADATTPPQQPEQKTVEAAPKNEAKSTTTVSAPPSCDVSTTPEDSDEWMTEDDMTSTRTNVSCDLKSQNGGTSVNVNTSNTQSVHSGSSTGTSGSATSSNSTTINITEGN